MLPGRPRCPALRPRTSARDEGADGGLDGEGAAALEEDGGVGAVAVDEADEAIADAAVEGYEGRVA